MEDVKNTLMTELSASAREHGETREQAKSSLLAALEVAETRLREEMMRLSTEHDRKHKEFFSRVKLDIERLSDAAEAKQSELWDATRAGLARLKEEIALLENQQDAKLERGQHQTTASFELLERRLDTSLESRAQEMLAEREVRSREVADLCSAVKSMQSWLADVETSSSQRHDARGRELVGFSSRLDDLKDQQFSMRADFAKMIERNDGYRDASLQHDEQRKVLLDLCASSSAQGEKIQDLEAHVQSAREARSEVTRLSVDLREETSNRVKKDNEIQARLEREVSEFARRIDRLATATSQLDNQLSEGLSRRSSFANSTSSLFNGPKAPSEGSVDSAPPSMRSLNLNMDVQSAKDKSSPVISPSISPRTETSNGPHANLTPVTSPLGTSHLGTTPVASSPFGGSSLASSLLSSPSSLSPTRMRSGWTGEVNALSHFSEEFRKTSFSTLPVIGEERSCDPVASSSSPAKESWTSSYFSSMLNPLSSSSPLGSASTLGSTTGGTSYMTLNTSSSSISTCYSVGEPGVPRIPSSFLGEP